MAWLAVDKDGAMWAYSNKPKRSDKQWICAQESTICIGVPEVLVDMLFNNNLTWKDEPIEIRCLQ